jgi:hypothetical protein
LVDLKKRKIDYPVWENILLDPTPGSLDLCAFVGIPVLACIDAGIKTFVGMIRKVCHVC